MSKTENPVRAAIESALQDSGFVRKGDSWYRRSADAVEVINIQKSDYGAEYYLNFGVWLNHLGENTFPKEQSCHIRIRGGAVVAEREALRRLMNLDVDMSIEARCEGIATTVRAEILPLANDCQTLWGLRRRLSDGSLKGGMVAAAARRYLTTDGSH